MFGSQKAIFYYQVEEGSGDMKRVSAAARQRQTTYELERHPFEANTLTQLFLILSKHKASWWREQNDDAKPSSTEQAQTSPNLAPSPTTGMDASLTSAMTPMKRRTHQGTPLLDQSGTRTIASERDKPINDPKELLKRRKEFVARQQRDKQKATSNSSAAHQSPPVLQIPDTVVWENNIPKGWFYFDAKEMHVARRKVETKQIQEAFLKDALFENDIVAVVYSVSHNHNAQAPGGCAGGFGGATSGHHGGGTQDGIDALQYRYLTAAELPIFLFENRRGKGTSVLQKFTYSLNIQHNDCIQVVWSPSVTQVNRRQNIHDIFDERIDPNERCGTFECRTHLSRNVQCTPRLQQRITEMCLELVKHFQETDSKFVVSRMVLHTKITDASDLVLLYCSSARVLPASAAMPLPLPSGSTLTVFPDPSASGSSGASQLQKKFRVSLEIATQYLVKPVEDQRHSNATSKRRGSVKGPSNDELGAALLEGRRSSMRNVSLNGADSPGRSSPVSPTHHGDQSVTVGGRSAAHHGFLLRSASPHRASGGSPTPSPLGKSLNGDRGKLMSFRSSSSAERLSLIGIVQDVLRSEEKKEGITELQRSKAKHLLQAAMKKVGPTSMRTAILQTRPNEELTEYEKMELLFLKMQELERRRMRKASSALSGGRTASPNQGPPQRGALGHASFEEPMPPSANQGSLHVCKKNVVMDGALAGEIDASVEDRWMELAYAAQTHFDTQAFGGRDMAFSVNLDGRSGYVDAAIIRWLQARKAVTTSIGEIRCGVAQLEGATFRFEVNDSSCSSTTGGTLDENAVTKSQKLITWTIPQQIRAAQKVFHEAHEAMTSHEFARFVREAELAQPRHAPPPIVSVEERVDDASPVEAAQYADDFGDDG